MVKFDRLRTAKLFTFTIYLTVTGCSATLFDDPTTPITPSKSTTNHRHDLPPHATDYGWIHAGCFATLNPNDLTGFTVKIIDLQGDRILHGRITQRIDSLPHTGTCYPLNNTRQPHNLMEGRSFYSIETDSNIGLAIGVLGDSRFDVDPVEGYSYCQGADRFIFTAWEKAPYTSDKRWEDSYYVDYPLAPNCP